MKRAKIALALGFTGVMALSACNDNDTDNASGEEIVNVNGNSITEEQLVDDLKEQHGELMFNQMIQNTVLSQKAEELGIGEEEVEAELDELKEQFGIEDDEQLLQMFQMQMQIPVESIEELKEEFLLPQVVIQELAVEGVDITDEEKRDHFEENEEEIIEVEARHILVEEEETAEEVLAQLEDGMAFEDAVEEYSEDTASVEEGGNVGYFKRTGQMDENFSETAFELEIGEISDPVESQFGYHIIEVLDRQEAYENFEEEIETQLTQQQSRIPEEVMQELMQEADIEVTDSNYEDWLMPMEEPAPEAPVEDPIDEDPIEEDEDVDDEEDEDEEDTEEDAE